MIRSAKGFDEIVDQYPRAQWHVLAMQQTPESAGALIYRGALFKLNQPEKDAVFSYERRVNDTPTGLSATLLLPGRHCTALTSATRHTRTASIRFPSRRAAF